MEYITILNYNTGEVFYKKLTEKDNHLLDIHIEQFFESIEMNTDECAWMFGSSRPILNRID